MEKVDPVIAKYRTLAQKASYSLEGICFTCGRTYVANEIKQIAFLIEQKQQPETTKFLPCMCGKGVVDVSFVIKSKDAAAHVFEYYTPQQILRAFKYFIQQFMTDNSKFVQTLCTQAPELLWNYTYHFGILEDSQVRL